MVRTMDVGEILDFCDELMLDVRIASRELCLSPDEHKEYRVIRKLAKSIENDIAQEKVLACRPRLERLCGAADRFYASMLDKQELFDEEERFHFVSAYRQMFKLRDYLASFN